MKRFTCSPQEAYGYVLAEPIVVDGKRLGKGRSIDKEEASLLEKEGIEQITVMRISIDDIVENAAAYTVSKSCLGENVKALQPRQGLVSITSLTDGVLRYDSDTLFKCNKDLDQFVIAAMKPLTAVHAGITVATVKSVPLAMERTAVAAAAKVAPKFAVDAYQPKRIALLQTKLPETADKLLEKAASTTAARLMPFGSKLSANVCCVHDCASAASKFTELAEHDLILAIGANSANSAEDVLPAAMLAAGGDIISFGVPYEPGLLTVVGRIGKTHVLIMPGSARSRKRGSYDLLLEWLHAGIQPDADAIAHLSSGGLHRQPDALVSRRRLRQRRIAGVLLAAGMSRRMGKINKLSALHKGKPLVRHAGEIIEKALDDKVLSSAIAVCGHEHEDVEKALIGLNVRCVNNPDYATGMASSLKTALQALPRDTEAAIVLLGDMPAVTVDDVKAVATAFEPDANRTLIAACHRGKRGNPVLIGAQHFAEVMAAEGDIGARSLFARYPVAEVEAAPGVLRDIDLPEDL